MRKQLVILLTFLFIFSVWATACTTPTEEPVVTTEEEPAAEVEEPEVAEEPEPAAEAEEPVEAEEPTAETEEEESEEPVEESEEAAEEEGPMMAEDQTFISALRANCMQGNLWTTCGHRLDATVMQPLAATNWTADGTVTPLLAESWEMEEDGAVWVVNLREGVTWHDGEVFDADDVIYSFNTYADPDVGSRWHVKLVDVVGYDEVRDGSADSLSGVTKVDDYTVRIELKQAQPIWWNYSQIFIVIMPEHLLADIAPEELQAYSAYWQENRVGTGPFVWTEYVPDQFVEVVANDAYFLGRPKLDRIIYRIFAESPALLNAFENQEVDIISFEDGGIPLTELSRFETLDFAFLKADQDAGLPTYFFIKVDKEPFSDVRFRQAMMYAIDRQTIIDEIFEGKARLANTLFPAEWTHPDDLISYDYDPDRARDLLDEMGWEAGGEVEVDLQYFYGDPVTADVMVILQTYLQDVGINLVPRKVETTAWRQSLTDGSWQLGYGSNGQGLDPSVGSDPVRCGSTLALGYCNERVDELFALGKTVESREERAVYYQEISQILNEELPKTFLWYLPRPVAFNTRVVGLAEHWAETDILMFNVPVYMEIENWYIQAES